MMDKLVNEFLLNYQNGILNLYNIYFKQSNKISYKDLIEMMIGDLKNTTSDFLDKNDLLNNDELLEELNSHLFYFVNQFCKDNYTPPVIKQKQYICPGCLFLGYKNSIDAGINLNCKECAHQFKLSSDIKYLTFFKVFKNHSKVGFKCFDCKRFIPSQESNIITCPYIDCCFVGNTVDLKKMLHPTSEYVNEKDEIFNILESKHDVRFTLINNVIEKEINLNQWNGKKSFNYKIFVYQAFQNILNKFPKQATSYLLDNSRSGGFQHKIFQEFISILENNFPISIRKNKKNYSITSLLDENLALFDGISTFEAVITDKLFIKNNTTEFYIGGRLGSYTKPYYIGKLLNIIEKETGNPILQHVEEYSFSKIKLKNVKSNTKVIVSHLRIPPHYQMGGMVYVNRIRKNIIDEVKKIS